MYTVFIIIYSTYMNLRFKLLLLMAALLTVPVAAMAGIFESVDNNRPLTYNFGAQTDPLDGSISLNIKLSGARLQSFQEKDPGKAEIVDAIMDPTNRRYILLSIRLDNTDYSKSIGQPGTGSFITKIFRYDLETGKLWRIYRETKASGYGFKGFVGNRLLLYEAPFGDNSPGPCWLEQELTEKTQQYIDVKKPWLGIKTWAPSSKFIAQREKALETCQGE